MDEILGANLLGIGFNSLGTYDHYSFTKAILGTPAGDAGTYTDPYSGYQYYYPNNVSVTRGGGDATQEANVIVGQDQQQFESSLSAQAGIKGSYRGFSGAFNFAFSTQSQSQTMYWYCLAQGTFQSWIVLLQEASQQQWSSEFANDPDVQALLKLNPPVFNSSNQALFFRIFEKWGTHYMDQITVGGRFDYYAAVQMAYSSDQSTIQSDLKLEYKSLFVDAAAQAQLDWQTLGQQWSSDRQTSWSAEGGNTDPLQSIPSEPGYGENFGTVFKSWAGSVAATPVVIDFHLTDLSTLFSGDLVGAVSDALDAYTNQGVYVSAEFNNTTSPATISGLIMESANTIPNPEPQPAGTYGGIQLAVFDGFSLGTLVNVSAYINYDADAQWEHLYQAVKGLTQPQYIVALTAFGPGLPDFPTPDFATWLQGCGASLSSWKEYMGQYCGEDAHLSYVLVGQQGLQPGEAAEKWITNDTAPPSTTKNPTLAPGVFPAILSVPLIPPSGSGPYQISTATSADTLALLREMRAARAGSAAIVGAGSPGAVAGCYWAPTNSWWDVGDLTCFDGTARLCLPNGQWEIQGSC